MSNHHGMGELKNAASYQSGGHVPQRDDRFGRIFALPPLYNDPRELEKLGAQGGPMDDQGNPRRTQSVPVGHVFFGQFIDHDITLDVTSTFSEVADPGEIPNARTPTLDLDCIYGAGPEASPHLYHGQGAFKGIKLLTGADGTAAMIEQGGRLVPQPEALAKEDLTRTAHGTAIIGDPRNDENRIVSQLQLAMLRFHNFVVEKLHGNGLEGKELYEEARRTTTWHYQWVVVNDFLTKMCGRPVVCDILANGRQIYCPDGGEPFIPVEFSVAAYRFGHSMAPNEIQIQRGDRARALFGDILGGGFSPLASADAVVDWLELVDQDPARVVQMAETLDTKLAKILLDLPFITQGISSLATRNLLRGQTFLLPSGENVARALGRPEEEIEVVREVAREAAGRGIDLCGGTPLWFYILAEAEKIGRETTPGRFEQGEGLGPVGARIVAETLIGLIELDPRSYLGSDRSWEPRDGVEVSTLGEMLTAG